ncbi:MAG: prepilin peptidase [Phaeospirillum sp.]|nr:prepilin peptidase [Phaeospirillum sp.]
MSSQVIVAGAGLVFLVGLLDAAVSDLRAFRIANRSPLILLAAFVPAAMAAGFGWQDWLLHFGAGLALLVVGVVLFARGVWGGGDAKLLPAAVVWTGFAGLPRFLVVMALVGGALAVVALLARRIPLGRSGAVRAWGERLAESGHVPYGVAIAAAGIDWWFLALLPDVIG